MRTLLLLVKVMPLVGGLQFLPHHCRAWPRALATGMREDVPRQKFKKEEPVEQSWPEPQPTPISGLTKINVCYCKPLRFRGGVLRSTANSYTSTVY